MEVWPVKLIGLLEPVEMGRFELREVFFCGAWAVKEGFLGCWLVWYLGQIALYQILRIAEHKRGRSGDMDIMTCKGTDR